MIVRELIAMFGFQVDKKSESSVESSMQGIIKGAKLLGTALIAGAVTKGIFDLVEGTAEMADNLGATAQKLGVGAQALQGLHFAGKLANVSTEEMNNSLRVLGKNAFEAGEGNKTAQESFKRLGVSVRGANGQLKPVDTLMTELGDRFKNLGSDTERLAVAQKLFGRGGAALIPLLSQGSAAIAAQRKELEDLGGVIDNELIEQGDRFTDNQDKMRTAVQGLKNVVAKALLPVFNESVEATLEWFKANREVIRQNLVAFLEKAIAAFGRIKRFIVDVVDTVVDWAKSLDPVQSGLLKVAAAAAGLALLLALPLAPLFLLAGLVFLLIDDFQTWREGGKSVIGELIKGFDELIASAGKFISESITRFKAWVDEMGGVSGLVVEAFIAGWKLTFDGAVLAFDAIAKFLVTWGPTIAKTVGEALVAGWDAYVSATKKIFEALGEFVVGLFSKVWEKIGDQGRAVLKGAFDATPLGLALKAGKAAAGLFGEASPTATGRPSGGFSNEQTNNISVAVNAQGATNPAAVGLEVKHVMREELNSIHRETLGAFTVLAPAL